MVLDEEIADPHGKEFWKTKINTKQVHWDRFIEELREYVRDGCEARFQDLPKTPSDNDILEASDYQLNKYLAEAPPSHGQRILAEFTRRFGTSSPPPEAINDDDALSERFLKELLVKDDFVSMSSWGSTLRWFGPLFQPNKQVLFFDRVCFPFNTPSLFLAPPVLFPLFHIFSLFSPFFIYSLPFHFPFTSPSFPFLHFPS